MSSQPPSRRLGAVYRTEVTDAHIGQRVTIRHLVDTPEGTRPTDVVGYLRAWENGVLSVERRDGRIDQVPADRIVASRILPDITRPTRG